MTAKRKVDWGQVVLDICHDIPRNLPADPHGAYRGPLCPGVHAAAAELIGCAPDMLRKWIRGDKIPSQIAQQWLTYLWVTKNLDHVMHWLYSERGTALG